MAEKKDYEVGYGKPPKGTRFKPGQSGNPNGRPKGSGNFATDVQAILNEPIQVREGRTVKQVSAQKAALLKLRQDSLRGDLRALGQFIALANAHNNETLEQEVKTTLPAEDQEILDRFLNEARAGEVPDDA